VGRSNVGKSSLINALVRQKIARTSAAPGKTRLANIYRVARGSGEPLYLVDLPGYGYARGGRESARAFDELTKAYFAPVRLKADTTNDHVDVRSVRLQPDRGGVRLQRDGAALLLVDSRHAGLESDLEAWAWLRDTVDAAAIVATKIDKLARGQRIRAMRELESVFEHPVLPVSAVTGEGLDELWTLIDNLTNNRSSRKPTRKSSPNRLPKATAARLPTEARRRPKR
jgi:GTP-binding protein